MSGGDEERRSTNHQNDQHDMTVPSYILGFSCNVTNRNRTASALALNNVTLMTILTRPLVQATVSLINDAASAGQGEQRPAHKDISAQHQWSGLRV